MNKINILFVDPSMRGNSLELYEAFKRLKDINIKSLFKVNDKSGVYSNLIGNTILDKIMFKLKLPRDIKGLNLKLLTYDFNNTNVLFIVKGITVKSSTLRFIKNKYPYLKILSWSLDDMYAWHNRSIYYTLGLKYYDLVITTKSYNVDELSMLGAKRVLFLYQAYSKTKHKSHPCDTYKYEVLFIGYFEEERYESMLYLAKNGIKIVIYGSGWEKYQNSHKNLMIHNNVLIAEEYAKAISCAKISLCFLRKINRDLHTSRSIEIPACQGFMIAERTDEHKKLFKENKEAVYFDSNEELLEKVKYYLSNDKEREQITKAGYDKVLNGEYSYDDMVKRILDVAKTL